MLFVAKELGKSLEEVNEFSVLEMRMWAAFFQSQHKKQNDRMKGNGGHQHNRKTHR